MNTYSFRISTPDGMLFDGSVAEILLRGSDGDLAVLAGHIPFATAVMPGDVKITLEDDSVRIGHTEGGLLSVGKDMVTLLSSSFQWSDHSDKNEI